MTKKQKQIIINGVLYFQDHLLGQWQAFDKKYSSTFYSFISMQVYLSNKYISILSTRHVHCTVLCHANTVWIILGGRGSVSSVLDDRLNDRQVDCQFSFDNARKLIWTHCHSLYIYADVYIRVSTASKKERSYDSVSYIFHTSSWIGINRFYMFSSIVHVPVVERPSHMA